MLVEQMQTDNMLSLMQENRQHSYVMSSGQVHIADGIQRGEWGKNE